MFSQFFKFVCYRNLLELIFVFYDIYKHLCNLNEESPYNLPVKLGIMKSNSAVAQWKNGSIPRSETLKALADHFGVSISYLIDMDEETSPANRETWDLKDPINQELLELISRLSPAKKALLLEKAKMIESI